MLTPSMIARLSSITCLSLLWLTALLFAPSWTLRTTLKLLWVATQAIMFCIAVAATMMLLGNCSPSPRSNTSSTPSPSFKGNPRFPSTLSPSMQPGPPLSHPGSLQGLETVHTVKR